MNPNAQQTMLHKQNYERNASPVDEAISPRNCPVLSRRARQCRLRVAKIVPLVRDGCGRPGAVLSALRRAVLVYRLIA